MLDDIEADVSGADRFDLSGTSTTCTLDDFLPGQFSVVQKLGGKSGGVLNQLLSVFGADADPSNCHQLSPVLTSRAPAMDCQPQTLDRLPADLSAVLSAIAPSGGGSPSEGGSLGAGGPAAP